MLEEFQGSFGMLNKDMMPKHNIWFDVNDNSGNIPWEHDIVQEYLGNSLRIAAWGGGFACKS